MKAIWIGGVFSDEALNSYRAVNQAQNRWSLGVIRGLKACGWEFCSLAFRAEQLWPKGCIRPGKNEDFHPEIEPLLVPVWNLPFYREKILPSAYLKRLKNHVRKKGVPDVVISYNPLPWHVPVADWLSKTHGVPWISITLDLKNPGENMEHFVQLNQHAAGQVILSWWGYENCPLSPKLHLDGGYDRLETDEADYCTTAKKIILYSGKYSDYGGDALLADTIRAVKREDVEFWLLGKGENKEIEELGKIDPRVKRFGFVSEAELNSLCRKAHVFLNPRPNEFADNLMTYPSKLLFYMAFGKPIISTWTPGLSPEYRHFFKVPEEETGDSFSQMINQTLSIDEEDRIKLRAEIFSFLESSRSWMQQGQALDRFIRDILSRKKGGDE